ncbi:RidA family protein [Belliella kenyensis]|uniref:RidA family protein n=1 Tax=Belliella kenyensis TaxID=1472724 RepID=A0ABV8EJR5_9BACT|nr:RidA family protein [Belliella kenyensis]MCH7401251.1 RidA family protein [Belliella kenyensis]MDN3602697.1 RidA family protein [Belliella kenyensis]
MNTKYVIIICLGLIISSCHVKVGQSSSEVISNEIERIDRSDASILKGVFVPKGKDSFFTSGIVADLIDQKASVGDNLRYGNTYQQSISILSKIEKILSEAHFEMQDVVFLRVYLAPDRDGNIDWQAWFDAYGEYFQTENNPNKVARSTVAVYALANPDLLIEIEAVAFK